MNYPKWTSSNNKKYNVLAETETLSLKKKEGRKTKANIQLLVATVATEDIFAIGYKTFVGQTEGASLAVEAVFMPWAALVVHNIDTFTETCKRGKDLILDYYEVCFNDAVFVIPTNTVQLVRCSWNYIWIESNLWWGYGSHCISLPLCSCSTRRRKRDPGGWWNWSRPEAWSRCCTQNSGCARAGPGSSLLQKWWAADTGKVVHMGISINK